MENVSTPGRLPKPPSNSLEVELSKVPTFDDVSTTISHGDSALERAPRRAVPTLICYLRMKDTASSIVISRCSLKSIISNIDLANFLMWVAFSEKCCESPTKFLFSVICLHFLFSSKCFLTTSDTKFLSDFLPLGQSSGKRENLKCEYSFCKMLRLVLLKF